MPHISIVIPAYNAEAYLQRCLDSIFTQNYEDYEVLCINDGSTDKTPQILEDNAARHTNLIVISQSNKGMATARNKGIESASGDYILFVDSDDCLMPNALNTLASNLSEDIVGFGTKLFDERTGTSTDNICPQTDKPISGWNYFNQHRLKNLPIHFVCIWQRAYRRTFLLDNKLKFADGLRRAEDDLFTTMVMLQASSITTIKEILYEYRIRSGSITRSSDPRMEADSRRVQQILVDTFIPMQDIDKHVIYQVLASNYITRLSDHKERLSDTEWQQFHKLCVSKRHRRLYRILYIHPSLYYIYQALANLLHK